MIAKTIGTIAAGIFAVNRRKRILLRPVALTRP
jgi:hypothetical protein